MLYDIIYLMVRKKSNKKKFFYIQCGDWDGITAAKSPREACVQVVSQALELFKDKARFSKVMLCVDCSKSVENSQDDKDAFLVETILEEVNEH